MEIEESTSQFQEENITEETAETIIPDIIEKPTSTTKKGLKSSLKLKPKNKKTFTPDKQYDPMTLKETSEQVLERFSRGCECQEESCFANLNPDVVYKHRLNIAELTKDEHDMYLMGMMMACLTNPYETAKHTERQRLRTHYAYQGRRVCLDAFLYLENCNYYKIKRMRKHLMTHGVTPRIHGNHRKVPSNTYSLDIYQTATEFLKDFIEKQEQRQKTKLSKNAPLHLPSDITRKVVHDLYTEYCQEKSPDIKIMGYATFRGFLKFQFPMVKFAKTELTRAPAKAESSNEPKEKKAKIEEVILTDNFKIEGEVVVNGTRFVTYASINPGFKVE